MRDWEPSRRDDGSETATLPSECEDLPAGAVRVAGAARWVVLRASFPAREFFTLPRAVMRGLGQLPFDEQIGAVLKVVERWGLDDDPHQLASWEKLDALADLLPVWNAITDHLGRVIEQRNEQLKN